MVFLEHCNAIRSFQLETGSFDGGIGQGAQRSMCVWGGGAPIEENGKRSWWLLLFECPYIFHALMPSDSSAAGIAKSILWVR